ncbi:hypothetical protein GGR57DRAFT_517991 [Xylariaceae sp. FL1272]|nr:hypothetical protein GGR57DRAFT_517991 [Xylariaceae sp. FL1272]
MTNGQKPNGHGPRPLHPLAQAIWKAAFTKRSHSMFLDIFYRAKAVDKLVRELWTDFCLWSEAYRNAHNQEAWGQWSYQVGYCEPGDNPKWRIKYVLEAQDWSEMDRKWKFLVDTRNAQWGWRSPGSVCRRMKWRCQPDNLERIPLVKTPRW